MKSILSAHEPGAGLTPEQSRQIARVIAERFNFHEMARLSLGPHWQQRSSQERNEFVDLFGGLVARSQLLGMTTDADVPQRFVGERIEEERAVVHAQVNAGDGDISIDYFLLRRGGVWKICDLRIDGVRLSNIYRTQFNKVIARSSYDEVVRQIRHKQEELAFEDGIHFTRSSAQQAPYE
ncbi:MAG: phospholipid-binding protein MlaC [Nitrospiraceae bacterium]